MMDTEFIKVESPNYEDDSNTLIIPDTAKLRSALMFGRPQPKKLHACPHENCGAMFNKPSRLKIHLNIHTGKRPFKCTVTGCDKAYFKGTSLRRHALAHHTDSMLPKSLVPCSYPGCPKSLSSVSSLKKHLFRHLNSGKKKEQKPIRCSHCDAIFERLCDFNRHMRGHRTYICDIEKCGQLFQRRAHLRTHIATCHPADYICSECNKRYKSKSKLKVHLISHLNEEDKRKLHCPFENCTRRISSASSLNQHQRRPQRKLHHPHQGEPVHVRLIMKESQPPKHVPVNYKAYYHKQNLNHHIKTAHEGKKYECPLCNKSLTTKKILERHMSVHESSLDETCGKVDVTFSPVHKYPYIVDSLEKSLEQQEMLHKSLIPHRPANSDISAVVDSNDSSLDEYTLDAPESTLEPEVNLEESSDRFESDNVNVNFDAAHEDACMEVETGQYILPPDAGEVQASNHKTEQILHSVKEELSDPLEACKGSTTAQNQEVGDSPQSC